MVDSRQYELNPTKPDRDHPHWPNPIGEVPLRSGFDSSVKFVAAISRPARGTVTLDNRQPLAGGTLSLDLRREEVEAWPGVEMTRALFLTGEYLCDFFLLTGKQPHCYDWQVHTLGLAQTTPEWKPTDELNDTLYDMRNRAIAKRMEDPNERERYRMTEVVRLDVGDQPWHATVLQTCAIPDVSKSVLGKAWYDRRIGVRVHMLGEAGTRVFLGRSPVSRTAAGLEKNKGERSDLPNEVGGTTVLVSRNAASTLFAALHEPLRDASSRIAAFRRIQQTAQGIAVAVEGAPESPIRDRALFRFWDRYEEPLTLAGDGEHFTFADRAWIRIGKDRVDVSGDLRAMELKVDGQPALFLNGQRKEAKCTDGKLVFGP
jgi:hypothetical protein